MAGRTHTVHPRAYAGKSAEANHRRTEKRLSCTSKRAMSRHFSIFYFGLQGLRNDANRQARPTSEYATHYQSE